MWNSTEKIWIVKKAFRSFCSIYVGGEFMLYNVQWKTSQTKKIYQATLNSELLMEYLEERLIAENIVKLISEKPTPSRGYGVLYYYYNKNPKKRLLSAAPRRDHEHIHVVIFNRIINRQQLFQSDFDFGNSEDPIDILIHRKEEIDKLVLLIKSNL